MMKNSILYVIVCSAFFSLFICACSSLKKQYTNNVTQADQSDLVIVKFQDAPDSVWRGIVNFSSSYGEMNGDFAIVHSVEDSLWAINISGPFGVSILKARKSYDSLEVNWVDEYGIWNNFRSWTQNEYDPIIPFGDLFFSLCVGFAPGNVVEIRDESVFIIFENTLYAILAVDKTQALSVLQIEGEEYNIEWKRDDRGVLVETHISGDFFRASFNFR